jgi:hypothetical protein
LGKALADYYRSHIERWADALGQEPQWLAERLFNQVLFNQRLEDLQYVLDTGKPLHAALAEIGNDILRMNSSRSDDSGQDEALDFIIPREEREYAAPLESLAGIARRLVVLADAADRGGDTVTADMADGMLARMVVRV